MADILIRNVDEAAIEQLKANAKRKGRSLQEELREIIRQAARDPYEFGRFVQEQLADYKTHIDPVESIREDRDSR